MRTTRGLLGHLVFSLRNFFKSEILFGLFAFRTFLLKMLKNLSKNNFDCCSMRHSSSMLSTASANFMEPGPHNLVELTILVCRGLNQGLLYQFNHARYRLTIFLPMVLDLICSKDGHKTWGAA